MRIAAKPLLGALLAVLAVLPESPLMAQETSQDMLVGRWEGALDVGGGQQLRLAFVIEADDEGALSAVLYSLDQTPDPIPTSGVAFADGTLTIEVAAVAGGYEGAMQEDGTFAGTWSQGMNSLPLALTKAEDDGSG